MKKIRLNDKLSLNKETIARLNDAQMNDVKGGRIRIASIGKNCTHLDGKCGPGGDAAITKGKFCSHFAVGGNTGGGNTAGTYYSNNVATS